MRGLLLLFDGFRMAVGDAAFYAIFGFLFVGLGITLLVLFFMLLGTIMKHVNAKKGKNTAEQNVPQAVTSVEEADGVTPELVAAITAALMAYYEEEKIKCDFVVRRIKRI